MVLIKQRKIREEEIVVDKIEVSPTVSQDMGIKFGVMADIHLDWEEWAKFLATAKDREEKFMIVAGDMTSLGKKTELIAAKKVLDEAKIKYYVVPGNHDLWEGAKLSEPLFNEVFGSDYQSFIQGRYKFILIDNGSATGLGEGQTVWIENEVKECRIFTCIAVMHMPLNNNFSAHIMGEGNKKVAGEAANLIKLFQDNGVVELIAGHLHYATSYEIDGVQTTIVGAISRDRNNQTPRYTEFVVTNRMLEREVIE